MNWMLLALVTIGAGIVTSLTDWFFAGDWLHRRWTYAEIWRQGVEAKAIALTSPLPFLTCGVFSYVTARLGIHSVGGSIKLAIAVWLIGPLPLILTNAAFMKLLEGLPVIRTQYVRIGGIASRNYSLHGVMKLMGMNEFQRLLLQNAAFTPPRHIVSSIPENTRTLRIANVPHSIAEELWHIVFWQDHFLRCARREDFVYPQHADLGWRRLDSFSNSQWEELVARFESGLTEAAGIPGQTQLAERYSTFEEPGSGTGPLTLLELIVNLAVHNAYHLGRIVQMRQVSGCWPPPAGGDSW